MKTAFSILRGSFEEKKMEKNDNFFRTLRQNNWILSDKFSARLAKVHFTLPDENFERKKFRAKIIDT